MSGFSAEAELAGSERRPDGADDHSDRDGGGWRCPTTTRSRCSLAGDAVLSLLFPGVYRAPWRSRTGGCGCPWLDRCSVEGFAGDVGSCSRRWCSDAGWVGLAAFAAGGTADLEAATTWSLRAIWAETGP